MIQDRDGSEKRIKAKGAKTGGAVAGNAGLMEQMEGLLALMESGQAMGRSADEIEQDITGRLRVLGKSSLQGWAQRANEAACGEAKGHVHKKKLWWLGSFGRIEVVETVRRQGRGKLQRAFKQRSGVRNRGVSKRLRRAMVDFGADSSFEKRRKKWRGATGWKCPRGG